MHAESENEKEAAQKELQQLKKDIAQLQKNLKSKQKQQSKAITQLRDSEKKIATATKILRSTKRQLIKKESQLKKSRRQQKNLENNKKNQKKALASQIKSAFISGRQEYLKMLLNQEDPEALGRMLVYYDYMNKARTEKVAKLQKILIDLENIDKVIQKEITSLNILKKSKEDETKRLNNLKTKRKKLVAALTKEIESKSEKLTELEINASELQDLIDSVREAIENIDFTQPLEGLRSMKGKLAWPTKGKHAQSYGSKSQGVSHLAPMAMKQGAGPIAGLADGATPLHWGAAGGDPIGAHMVSGAVGSGLLLGGDTTGIQGVIDRTQGEPPPAQSSAGPDAEMLDAGVDPNVVLNRLENFLNNASGPDSLTLKDI